MKQRLLSVRRSGLPNCVSPKRDWPTNEASLCLVYACKQNFEFSRSLGCCKYAPSCHCFRSYLAFQHVADLIGADSKDIVFTSGATESNNMSIKGIARFHKDRKKHLITTQTVCPSALVRRDG